MLQTKFYMAHLGFPIHTKIEAAMVSILLFKINTGSSNENSYKITIQSK